MGNLYIGIIMLCRIAQHLCNKKSSDEVKNMVTFVHYGAFRQILSAVLAFFLILAMRNGFRCDFSTVVIAGISGLMLIASMGCNIMVLQSGTIALASLFSTAGLLVPCVAGIFLFGQPMSAGQWAGVALFLIAAYFLISSSGKIYHGFSWKTFLLLLGVMLSNGITMLAQQMFSYYVPNGDVSVFSLLSFGIGGILMLFFLPVTAHTEKAPVQRLSGTLIGYGVVLSAAVFIINQLATLATALVPPAILFSFINGGSTVIGTIVAAICFKEKLTLKSVVGVALGVASLIIIKVL